jgi:hypothetical protein
MAANARLDSQSSTQTLAPFGSAGLNNAAAANSSHARTETVAAFANKITGLESPFHDGYS